MASKYWGDTVSLVPNSPAIKRQKTASGYNSTSNSASNTGYNSEVDSGDELFKDYVPATPAKAFETQPTQILDRPFNPSAKAPNTPSSVVQVPASSPIYSSEHARQTPTKPTQNGVSAPPVRSLALSMAPAGTLYRPPQGIVTKPPTAFITIDDDEDEAPRFKNLAESSDEEGSNRANIKPSRFVPQATSNSFQYSPTAQSREPVAGNEQFRSIVANATYPGPGAGRAPPGIGYHATSNGNATRQNNSRMSVDYGTVRKPPTQVQMRPDRAKPILDMAVNEVSDEKLRDNISRLRQIFPTISVLEARNALIFRKGSLEDAAELLAGSKSEPEIIDLEDGPGSQEQPRSSEVQMKRGLKQPLKSLRDKYSSTQALASRQSDSAAQAKPKKRLIQGRKNRSPSPASSPLKPQASPAMSIEEFDSDSGIASATDEDPELEDRVLRYLNTCNAEDLVELTNITKTNADMMVAARPFKNLDSARDVQNTATLKSGKKSTRAPIGDRIVETALQMFSGYEAIDELVAKCEQLGKPLTEEMEKWGFDVFGANKAGELEMTSFDDENDSQRDSGVGSPSSGVISSNGDDEVKAVRTRKKSTVMFLKKPELMAEDCVLKDYQVVGLNWLALMYRKELSCILADEMGLGKTCQVISFLAHLVENGISGPHLVICPGSTLENWLREIKRFAPNLVVEPYHGMQKERVEMAEAIMDNRDRINVIVTTYDMAAKSEDNRFMRKLKPDVCVYDEGHLLKNVKSQRYKGLIRIPAKFRLLLTGTPLQNNLQELTALLAFILPDVFHEREDDLNYIFKAKVSTSDSNHAALLSAERIARARSMLTPFVLRRKKAQVLKHLPAKTCRVEYCTLHPSQKEIYDGHLEQARARALLRVNGGKVPKTEENNPLMQLRKAAIHPLLFRRHFTNAKIEKMADVLRKKEPVHFLPSAKRAHLIEEMRNGSDFWLHQWCIDYPCISSFDIPDLAWLDSGKVEALVKLVKGYKENGDRVLIFSQFSLVLDILEAVLNTSLISFTRIDGSTKIDERQSLIDTYRDDESITAFLLTTKAGGTGINLMYANKVIIFDGSFNPQDDRQAENRAHRVGQTRPVEVVRLVTKGTVEEQIYALGRSKLVLDGRVAGDEEIGEDAGEKAVAKMLLEGTVVCDNEEGESGDAAEEKADGNEGESGEKVSSASSSQAKAKPALQRKKSSILDMLTKKEPAALKKGKGKGKGKSTKEKDIVETDPHGDEMLV